ncbi:hypothetical protein [Flavobacterium difficile]|uniref:HMA domain-containing protein n=1 Tax=Flavobacterium difficile TaxID=2709659 RepID=A0ABX0I033_9FLAO|nr:hypothetical protein [Flavobacterium difficile]NHM00555.1 hypothetical protein [Flavobacterium difficile]
MKINKKIKIILLSIFGIAFLLFAILVYHIANARPIENATIQISRIDFDKPFDSLSTEKVKKHLLSIDGVKSDIIVKNNVVVYFHDNRLADSKKVFNQLMKKDNYKASRFVLPASLANKQVCPVIQKDGLSYKFTKFVQSVFN